MILSISERLAIQFAVQNDCFPEQYQFDQSQFDAIIDPIVEAIGKAVKLHTAAFIHIGTPICLVVLAMSCMLLY